MDADRNDQAGYLKRLASLFREKLVQIGGQGLNICQWENLPHTGREAGQYAFLPSISSLVSARLNVQTATFPSMYSLMPQQAAIGRPMPTALSKEQMIDFSSGRIDSAVCTG